MHFMSAILLPDILILPLVLVGNSNFFSITVTPHWKQNSCSDQISVNFFSRNNLKNFSDSHFLNLEFWF